MAHGFGNGEFQRWCERPGWEDVVPLPQNEIVTSSPGIVKIDYTLEYVDTMNCVRALIAKEEKSARALELTTEAIYMNPSNYTLWPYRRDILLALNCKQLFLAEFQITEQIIEDSPKCYQVWGHRKWLVTLTGDCSHEISMLDSAIESDSKNYHAWSHRLWVVKQYSLWQSEIKYLNLLLEKDPRNNSAWNARFQILCNTTDVMDCEEEFNYVFSTISKSPNNESPWNYLKGMLKKFPDYRSIIEHFCNVSCKKWPASPNPPRVLVHLLEFDQSPHYDQERYESGIHMCEQLATVLDSVHEKYWLYKKNQLQLAIKKYF